MKKATIIFILFMGIFSVIQAQSLYKDEKGVLVFCVIRQTNKTVLCDGGTNSDKKINIWKVTLSIENGHSESIVPRGIGIANISIYPDPIKPYSYEYCNYTYIENFEPNALQRHLDQSLYEWPIQMHKVGEIQSGELIKNTTYLYLYEGQKPKLTNWEFLGYRLKNDFVTNDPILIDMAIDSISSVPKVKIYRENTINKEEIAVIEKPTEEVKEDIVVNVDEQIEKNKIEPAFENKEETDPVVVIEKPIEEVKEDIVVNVDEQIDNVKPTVENKVEIEEVVADEKAEEVKIQTKKKIGDCPGEKSLEYKKMSSNSSDVEEQKAYSWLALYYSYVCKCESGSQGSDQLVPLINNVVDSFMSNTKGKYGKIPKVTKCKAPIVK